jgi:short-subunit dehydrogenase
MKRNADTGLFTKPSTLTVYGENTMSEREFVVVGGSQGIGLAITRLLYQSNQRVTVISRSMPAINELKTVSHLSIDITRDEIDAGSKS